MIKRITLVTLFTLLAGGLFAGNNIGLIDFGLKAGVTTQSTKILDGNAYGMNLDADPKTGFHVGIVARVNLMMFHIQPEILYQMNSYELSANAGGTASQSTVRISNMEFPLLFGVKMVVFRVELGPKFNLMTDTAVKKNTGDMHSVATIKPSVGWIAGVGADLGRFTFDARYNGQFSTPQQNIQIGDNPAKTYDVKMNAWTFSLGYMF